jgi:hypothetical protein
MTPNLLKIFCVNHETAADNLTLYLKATQTVKTSHAAMDKNKKNARMARAVNWSPALEVGGAQKALTALQIEAAT